MFKIDALEVFFLKRRQIVLSVFFLLCVLLSAWVYRTFDKVFPKAPAICYPAAEDVLSVSVVSDSGNSCTADTQALLARLRKATPTRRQSLNDTPSQRPYYFLTVEAKDRQYRYFIYEDNALVYIEIPYEGVYRTDKGIFQEIGVQ